MARLKNRRACCHGNGYNELLSCLMKTEILSVVAEQYSERETPFLARCVVVCAAVGTPISAVFSSLLSKAASTLGACVMIYADGCECFACACRTGFRLCGCVVWFCRYVYQSALSQSHPCWFTLRYALNLQRCIKVRHQMHHALAAPKHIIDSTHILLPIRPIHIKPTNYNAVAMGAIRLIGLISVRNRLHANFGHIPSRSHL